MTTETIFYTFLGCAALTVVLLWWQDEAKFVAELHRMKEAADRKRDLQTTHFRVADTGAPPPGGVERKANRTLHSGG